MIRSIKTTKSQIKTNETKEKKTNNTTKSRMGYHYSNGKRYEFWLGILLKARCRASRLAWKHTAEALMFQNFTLFNCGQILFTIIKKTSF